MSGRKENAEYSLSIQTNSVELLIVVRNSVMNDQLAMIGWQCGSH